MAHTNPLYSLAKPGSKSVWLGDKAKGRRVLLRHDKPMQLTTDEHKYLVSRGFELATYEGPELVGQYAPTPALNKPPAIPQPNAADLPGQYAALPSDKEEAADAADLADAPQDVDWDEVVADANASDVIDIIDGLDNPDEVRAVMAAEKAAHDRVTVANAGKARLKALKEDEE